MDPFVGEIRLVAFDFAPPGWALCDGTVLPIPTYQALFSVLKTMYGGDGKATFALPDLRCRVPMHPGQGASFRQGESGGEVAHVLTLAEAPSHTHSVACSTADATSVSPAGNIWAAAKENDYGPATGAVGQLAASTVTTAGGGAAHENMPPYVVINYIICTKGVFPPRP